MTEPDRPSNFDPRDAWNDFRASRFMFQAVIMGLMLLALVVSALVLPFGVTLLLAIASVPLLGFSVRRTLANWRDEDLRRPYVWRPLEQEVVVPSDWLRSSSILGKGENAYYEHRRSGYDLWAMLPTPVASFSLGLWLVLHDLANLASLLVAVAVIAIYVLTRSARFFTLLWSRLRRRLRNLSITLLGTVLLITLSFAIPIVPWVSIAAIGLPVYWFSHRLARWISTTYVITDATVVIDKTPWLIFGGTDRETLVFVGAKTWSVKRNFWERFWGVDSWKLTIGTLAQEDDPINAQLFHLPGGERLGSILQLLIVPRRE